MAPAQESRSLGDHLRALRSSAGGSLADMAVATRVSERYLRALESDVLDELPAPVFVKGFIRAYCAFPRRRPPTRRSPSTIGSAAFLPRGYPAPCARVPRKGWVGHPLAISSALLLIFGAGLARPEARQPADAGASRGSPVAAVRAPESAPGDGPAAATPGAQAADPRCPPPSRRARHHRQPVVPEHAAARRQGHGADLDPRADRRRRGWWRSCSRPALEREWTSDRRFVLTVGNAGGIEIVLNGRPLPSLGARGAVIHRLSLPELPGQGS